MNPSRRSVSPPLSKVFSAVADRMLARPWIYTIGIAAIYLVPTLLWATRPMWYDELLTFYGVTTGSWARGWTAVDIGVDLNPPLLGFLVHFSHVAFGATEISTRLPSIVSFLVMMIYLFAFLKRSTNALYGMCGMVLPLLSLVYPMSYEARAYSLMLAGAAVTLVSWQRAGNTDRRALFFLGITGGLMIALLSHASAVFLAIPFCLGEVVRSLNRKKIDWPIWGSFAVSAVALSVYPQILHSRNTAAVHIPFFRSTLFSFPRFFGELGEWYAVLLLAIFAAILIFKDPEKNEPSKPPLSPPRHEIAAMIGFLLIPVAEILLAITQSAIFYFRYGATAILGASGLLIYALYRAGKADNRIGAATLLILLAGFGGKRIEEMSRFNPPDIARKVNSDGQVRVSKEPAYTVPEHPLLSLTSELDIPVVIANGLVFLPVDHYAPAALASRLYFLVDDQLSLQYANSRVYEEVYTAIATRFPLRGHVEAYRQFVQQNNAFYVYLTTGLPLEWVAEQSAKDGIHLDLVARDGPALLFRATR